MGFIDLNDIIVTPLKRITVPGGDVLHALKKTDQGYCEFGEAYFSIVDSGAVKAWKMHNRMTLNLIVPIGKLRFVFFDMDGNFREIIIGESNYSRLTVPPSIWFGFQGIHHSSSLLLNIANIMHDPQETERKDIAEINYDWTIK